MNKKKIKKFLFSHWLIFVLGLTFFLRLPSLFEPFTYGDEGICLTLGQSLKRGLVWYRDIHDNKPPLLYLLAALTGSFSSYRLIFFIWSFITIFMFSRLAFLLFPKRKPALIITTTLFAILISFRTFEGNVANAENFLILPTITGFYLFLKNNAKKTSLWLWFLIGSFFSFATLFKLPAVFDFAAFFLLVIFVNQPQKLPFKKLSLLTAGFLTPILASFVYYAAKGAFRQYLTATFFQNLLYLSSWTPDKSQIFGLPWPLLLRMLVLPAVVVFLWFQRSKISIEIKLIILWFSFALFASLLSSRPYPHYLLQVLPALALSFGLIFQKRKQLFIPLFLSVALITTFLFFKFWYYPNVSYYQNFYQFALGQKSKESYFNYFGGQTQALYQTAFFLKSHTLPEEKIFIWGNQPSIYALANRLPVGRYTAAYHIIDFNGYQETIEALNENPPRYIVISNEEKRPFPDFFGFIQSNYILVSQIGDFQILRRIILTL